jgi:hypothetical protein
MTGAGEARLETGRVSDDVLVIDVETAKGSRFSTGFGQIERGEAGTLSRHELDEYAEAFWSGLPHPPHGLLGPLSSSAARLHGVMIPLRLQTSYLLAR